VRNFDNGLKKAVREVNFMDRETVNSMRSRYGIVFLCLMVLRPGLQGPVWAQQGPLRIYGPDGVFAPMKECAELFSQRSGIEVSVVTAPGAGWIAQARQDADIVYEETEFMLTKFMVTYPCLVDETTRTSLYPRPAGILVRKGNPKKIGSIADLAKGGVYVLDVNDSGQVGLWEDVAGMKGLISALRKNIAVSVATSAEAMKAWNNQTALDAWITFESTHHLLKESAELVRLPKDERVCRGTALAATNFYKNQPLARRFIDFLKTPEAHTVFQKWGWE
jgi:accessory colonization factor AcfC